MTTTAAPAARTCTDVVRGTDCGRPAKATLSGNQPVCGIHARSHESRGAELFPLQIR